MSSETLSKSLTLHVLKAYHHCGVFTLLAYLEDLIDTGSLALLSHESPDDNTTLSTSCDYLLKDDDLPAYRELMTRAFVAEATAADSAPRAGSGALKTKLKVSTPTMRMTELIDRAQARLFAKKGKPSNMITAGYRSAEYRAEVGNGGAGGGRQGITNFFVNTVIDAIQGPEWIHLLERVGDSVILHLLTETSIYVPLPNDCYCQLTGTPLIFVAPPKSRLFVIASAEGSSADRSDETSGKQKACVIEEISRRVPSKRCRTKSSVDDCHETGSPQSRETNSKPKPRTAADIPLARTSLFYARPCKQAKTALIRLGLPPDHILNRMKLTTWRQSKGISPDKDSNGDEDLRPGDRDGALEARHLSKYVFPLQYKLSNVFFVPPERLREEQFEREHFADREDEIDLKGACKTPVRLKNALLPLGRIVQRHKKCGYKLLLDKICPSKLKPDHADSTVDSSVVLKLISEEMTGTHLQTQIDLDHSTLPSTSNITLSMRGGSQGGSASKARSQTKYKPKFAEFMCNYAEVFLYVRAVTKAIIPHALWGCERNRLAVMRHVKQFITGRRYEGMTLHNVIQGISTSECDWLLPSCMPKPPEQLNQSVAEMLKRRELLEEFLFWYFDQFLIPLLRTTFYVTESSAFRNRILYFRQDDWDVLCRPLLERLASTTFQRIHQHEAEELLQRRKLGYSYVRLLPKDSGVRPIVNLRRKKRSDNPYEQGQSINQILSAAFQILTYEKSLQAERLGASVFGPNDVYIRLKNFKQRVTDASGKMYEPKLYFVKVDVQACFDTIDQDKLLGVLKNLISEDAYMIQKYGQILPMTGNIKRTFVRKAMPEYEHPHFLTSATQLAALLRHTILVDQVVYPYAFRDDIMQLLEDHITSNIVKIGQDYYRQSVGIPQGSVLSTLLCSFFYGELERTTLRFVHEAREGVLLRLIDDYLFVTADVRDARQFLEVMNRGHPEYGCFISRDKTLTNFEHNVGDVSQLGFGSVLHPDQKFFPWCGYLIDTNDLSVMGDYSRFHETYLTDSLTVERNRSPNAAFLQKMLLTSQTKTHPIFTDTTHNSVRAVHLNVHQAFVLAAMKMHAYVRAVGRGGAAGLAFIPTGTAKGMKDLGGRKHKRASGAFLLSAIRQSIRFTYASMQNKVAGKIAAQAGGRCFLSKDAVLWLGAHAFHGVLGRKYTAYARTGVLGALHHDVHRARLREERRRLGRLARESLGTMLRDIRF